MRARQPSKVLQLEENVASRQGADAANCRRPRRDKRVRPRLLLRERSLRASTRGNLSAGISPRLPASPAVPRTSRHRESTRDLRQQRRLLILRVDPAVPRKPRAADTKAHRPEHNLQQQRPLLLILRADLAVPRKPKVADTKAHRPEHNLQQQRPLLILRADLAVRRKPKAADKKAHPPERNLPLRLLNAARADLERQGDREAEKRRAKPLRLQLRNRRQFDHASAPGLIWS